MYLRECLIENVGPIEFLDLSLPFNKDGNPQPLILVGVNGSGKSIVLSYLVDALTEFAKSAYRDIIPGQQSMYPPYFKLVGPVNQRINSEFGIGLLQFSEEDRIYSYIDKTGSLEPTTYNEKRRGRFEAVQPWPQNGNHKLVAPQDKPYFERLFRQNAICFFPPSRKEHPHWLNRESINNELRFIIEQKLTENLGKPIFIESSVQENKSWLLDVFLDSMVDIVGVVDKMFFTTSNLPEKFALKQSRANVEALLKQVLQDNFVRLDVNYRNASAFRLCVAKENKIVIPSLDHLSSGQSILFNMFATIIRYADKGDINNSIILTEIKGIVIIDEVDAHLHTDLQYEVLPKLIKLFPKVQFILTSHSPLFLLGMEREYGSNGFQIIEMPKGQPISTERFTEFKKSFDYYKETKYFEETVQNTILNGTKPMVFTEGEIDPVYIKTALELLGTGDLLNQLDIECVGSQDSSGSRNTGKDGLNNVKKVFETKPATLNRRLLLLYDCDTNKPKENIGLLSSRAVPRNIGNNIANEGIENLLPLSLFEQALSEFEERFYIKKIKDGKYGGKTTVQELDKKEFCKWVCEERRNVDDFKGFSVVVDILKEFLGIDSSSNANPEVSQDSNPGT